MSCLASDAISAVENAVMRTFDGEAPKELILRTDNGPQYIAKQLRISMNLLGIFLEYIQKHIPEDNSNIEWFHTHPSRLTTSGPSNSPISMMHQLQ